MPVCSGNGSFDVEALSSARTRGSAESPEMKPLKLQAMFPFF